MRIGSRVVSRRKLLLAGGAVGAAGMAGSGFASRGGLAPAVTSGAAPRSGGETLQLWGRHWHVTSTRLLPGELPGRGDRMLSEGVLLDGPEGEEIGQFYGHVLGLHAPGHDGPAGVASFEQHTFNLAGGTIIGSGTGTRNPDNADAFAIVGGTGSFAGASGSYVARQGHWELGGDGTAQFTLTILGR